MGRLRDKIKTDPDAGLHTLRHTFLTEAGEYTDAFTLVHRRAPHHQDHDAVRAPSGGVSQPGVRANQSEEEAGAVGVAADAKGAYNNAYSRLGRRLKIFI
jgi:hypothetical protein